MEVRVQQKDVMRLFYTAIRTTAPPPAKAPTAASTASDASAPDAMPHLMPASDATAAARSAPMSASDVTSAPLAAAGATSAPSANRRQGAVRFQEPDLSDVADSCQINLSDEPLQSVVHFQEPSTSGLSDTADSAVSSGKDRAHHSDAARNAVGSQSEAAVESAR